MAAADILTKEQRDRIVKARGTIFDIRYLSKLHPQPSLVSVAERAGAIIDRLLAETERLGDSHVRTGVGEPVIIPSGLRLAALLKWLRDHAGCAATVTNVDGFSVRCDAHAESFSSSGSV